jgi:hypothetical protein
MAPAPPPSRSPTTHAVHRVCRAASGGGRGEGRRALPRRSRCRREAARRRTPSGRAEAANATHQEERKHVTWDFLFPVARFALRRGHGHDEHRVAWLVDSVEHHERKHVDHRAQVAGIVRPALEVLGPSVMRSIVASISSRNRSPSPSRLSAYFAASASASTAAAGVHSIRQHR